MSDIPKLEVATHESYKDGSKHIGRIVDCAECMDGNEVEVVKDKIKEKRAKGA